MSKFFTYATSALCLLAMSFTTVSIPLSVHADVQCENLFVSKTRSQNPLAKFGNFTVEVDGVNVTGDGIKEIRKNLDLTDALLSHLKENVQSVLSLGEGYSDLLPFLIEKGIHVKGLDLWYHSKNLKDQKSVTAVQMEKFQNLYASHLIRGTALDIPLQAESVDFVISHRLFNSLHIAQQLKVITETIRVLKISGEAHLLLNYSREARKSENLAYKTILNYINENYAASINAQISNGLLIIDKIGSTKTFDQLVIPFDENGFYEDLPNGAKTRKDQEDASLTASYAAALALYKKNPDNQNLAVDIYTLENKIKSFKKAELTKLSPLETLWLQFKSRFSAKPYIRE